MDCKIDFIPCTKQIIQQNKSGKFHLQYQLEIDAVIYMNIFAFSFSGHVFILCAVKMCALYECHFSVAFHNIYVESLCFESKTAPRIINSLSING